VFIVLTAAAAPAARATDVSVQGATLVVRAAPGERNVIAVEPVATGYAVSDQRAPLVAGPGCQATAPAELAPPAPGPAPPPRVECTGTVVGVDVDAGDLNDLVGLWDVAVPVRAEGGPGDDLIETGGAADTVSGGTGTDSLVLGGGDDQAAGGGGDDLLAGDDGADRLAGDAGADMIEGGPGSGDVLSGGPSGDLIRGGPGDDTVDGEGGDDALIGGGGNDALTTGSGTDVVFAADGGPDTVTCRPGDRVRGAAGERPQLCSPLPAAVTAPAAWPPVRGGRRAAPAMVPPDPKVRITLRQRGNARRISVQVPARIDAPVTLRFLTYDRARHRVRSFYRDVRTKHWQSFTDPDPGPGAWYVRGRCCR
jgi:Ca2+-binding RTX toxin-like protein